MSYTDVTAHLSSTVKKPGWASVASTVLVWKKAQTPRLRSTLRISPVPNHLRVLSSSHSTATEAAHAQTSRERAGAAQRCGLCGAARTSCVEHGEQEGGMRGDRHVALWPLHQPLDKLASSRPELRPRLAPQAVAPKGVGLVGDRGVIDRWIELREGRLGEALIARVPSRALVAQLVRHHGQRASANVWSKGQQASGRRSAHGRHNEEIRFQAFCEELQVGRLAFPDLVELGVDEFKLGVIV